MAIGGLFVFSSYTGVATFKTAGLVAGGSGIVGTILTVFSNGWQFIIACAYGHLGLYGWLFIIGLVGCLGVWGWNGFKDIKANRPIGFVD